MMKTRHDKPSTGRWNSRPASRGQAAASPPPPSPDDARAAARATGTVLVVVSAIFYAPAGIWTRLAETDSWTIMCWRSLFSLPLLLAYVAWRGGARPWRLGPAGWLIATACSIATVLYIVSFKLTYVGNVALIYATAPFVAALMGWLVLRDPVRPKTMLAALVALAGVGVIVAGGVHGTQLRGDLVALAMTVAMSGYMVLVRRFPEVPTVLAAGASCAQLVLLGAMLGEPLCVAGWQLLILAGFGITFSLAIVLLMEGLRRVTAAEAGLLGTADVPVALFLAWLVLAEVPPPASFVGGAVVIAAVSLHAISDMRRRRRVAPAVEGA